MTDTFDTLEAPPEVLAEAPAEPIVQVSVSAPGAAPPAAGKIGNTLKANTAPVTAVNETASVVLAAVSASAHIASNSELVAPQSCSSSMVKDHCLSMDL